MHIRRPTLGLAAAVLLLSAPALRAANFRTQNFNVTAPTQELAERFGRAAEHFRRQKALEWLGQEMPPWPRPCPLHVTPKAGGAGGATKFNYDHRGNYDVLSMEIDGKVDRMLHSVLPHEVTHTVFAHHFRYPVPRWADEGGSVLSEDEPERAQHDRICRDFLNQRQAIPLRRLFQTREYQELDNVMVLYAQGYSVSDYLVNLGGGGLDGRRAFLSFVGMGMRGNWDQAAQTYYRFPTVDAMEKAWLDHLIEVKKQRQQGAATAVAQNRQPPPAAGADLASARSFVRSSAPPAQPQLDPAGPLARGQSPEGWDEPRPGNARLTSHPTHLPDPTAPASIPPLAVPTPPPPRPPVRPALPPVRLGLPEFGPAPVGGATP